MLKRCTVVTAALYLSGCATLMTEEGSESGLMERYAESRKLAQAVELLDDGNPSGAARLLSAVVSGKRIRGVTDEALFRLALLSLRNGEKGYGTAATYLRRLKKEYPGSPWSAQAAPLGELLNSAEELRQQNRSLKSTNQALNRELGELNKEIGGLNMQIRQLKNLDLELENAGR